MLAEGHENAGPSEERSRDDLEPPDRSQFSILLLIFMTAASGIWPRAITENGAELVLLYSAVAAIAVIVTGLKSVVNGSRESRQFGWLVTSLALLLLISLHIGYWSCPHASYIRVGPISVVVTGRPCRNVQEGFYRGTLFGKLIGTAR